MPPRNVVPKPVQQPAPAALGRVLAPRHDHAGRRARASARSRSRSSTPRRRARWTERTRSALAESASPIGELVNTEVACVTPMMVHHDEHEAIRRGLEGGNFFGYSLAFYAAFGDHVPGTTDLWQDFQNKRARARLSTPRSRSPSAGARREGRAGRELGAARRGRHARAAARLPAPLRGGRRRPAHLRAAGGQEPARAHHGVASSCSAARSCPEFKDRDAEAARREGGAARAASSTPRSRASSATRRACPPATTCPRSMKQLFKAGGGDALLEKIAEESAVGGDGFRSLAPARGAVRRSDDSARALEVEHLVSLAPRRAARRGCACRCGR